MADEDTGRLTPKQEAFALAYVETGNAAEAYRRAYDNRPAVFPSGCYTYALVEEFSQRILYIGKGTADRMHHHLRDVRKGKIVGLKKFLGLAAALERGDDIQALCIEDQLSSYAAIRFERHLIAKIGYENLLNSVAGQTTAHERAVAAGTRLAKMLESKFEYLVGERLEMAMRLAVEAWDAVDLANRLISSKQENNNAARQS